MKTWTPKQVASWVRGQGLGAYADALARAEIDGATLCALTYRDLRDLGVRSVGHRLRLLKAVFEEKRALKYSIDELADYVPETILARREIQSAASARTGSRSDAVAERDELLDAVFQELALSGVRAPGLAALWQRFQQLQTGEPGGGAPAPAASAGEEKPPGATPPTVIKVFRPASSKGPTDLLYKTFLVKPGRDRVSALVPQIVQKLKLDESQQYCLCLKDGRETVLPPNTPLLRFLVRFKSMANYPAFFIRPVAAGANLASSLSLSLSGELGAASAPKRAAVESSGGSSPLPSPLVLNGRVVAIFDYRAKRDDELNVAVGDRFRVLRLDSGWCVVQREALGPGQTSAAAGAARTIDQGWVPAVVLSNERDQPLEETLAEPLRGLVVNNYDAAKANELSVRKGDAVMVHRRYRHWLLLEGVDRKGWVPNWAVQLSPGASLENAAGMSGRAAASGHRRSKSSAAAGDSASTDGGNSSGLATAQSNASQSKTLLKQRLLKATGSPDTGAETPAGSPSGAAGPRAIAIRKSASESSLSSNHRPAAAASPLASPAMPAPPTPSCRIDSIAGSPLLSARSAAASPQPPAATPAGLAVSSVAAASVAEKSPAAVSAGSAGSSATSAGAKSKLDILMVSMNQLLDHAGGDDEPAAGRPPPPPAPVRQAAPARHAISVGQAVDLLAQIQQSTVDTELVSLVDAVLEKMHGVPRQSAIPARLEPLVRRLRSLNSGGRERRRPPNDGVPPSASLGSLARSASATSIASSSSSVGTPAGYATLLDASENIVLPTGASQRGGSAAAGPIGFLVPMSAGSSPSPLGLSPIAPPSADAGSHTALFNALSSDAAPASASPVVPMQRYFGSAGPSSPVHVGSSDAPSSSAATLSMVLTALRDGLSASGPSSSGSAVPGSVRP